MDAGEEIGRGFISGKPRPKGSLKPRVGRDGRGKMTITLHDDPDSEAWKRTMIKWIRAKYGIVPIVESGKIIAFDPAPYAGAVSVGAVFYFVKTIGVNGEVWPSHDTEWPMADDIGDTDKLQRNLGDALEQSGLIANDRNIVKWCDPQKRWRSDDEFFARDGVELVGPGVWFQVDAA
jgi:hypothetical protein